jgi:predicted nucleic-acid-binding protein
MSFTSLDANVVLRFVLNDVPTQSRRARAFVAATACYTTDVALSEVCFVLDKVYGLDREVITGLMSAFLRVETIMYNESIIDEVLHLYVRSRSLSFADCYAATEARYFGNDLVTFDKALVRKGGEHVKEPF